MPRVPYVPNTKGPGHPGRFRSGGPLAFAAPDLGVPFLTDLFGPLARLAVEAAFGADLHAHPDTWVWYDITDDVRYAGGGRVSISPMGRSDETSTAQPAGCAFELDNDSGDYTAYRPASRWHPYVRRNTPIRIRINLTSLPSDWQTRFQGYATGWTPGWDISANVATVAVAAQGITRRLSQGKTPLKAPLHRAILAAAPGAFWPLDDGAESTQAGSGLTSGTPMTVLDIVAFGEYTDILGTTRAPDMGAGSLHGVVPGALSPANQNVSWVAGFAMKTVVVPVNDPATFKPMLTFVTPGATGAYVRWEINTTIIELGEITLEGFYADGTATFFSYILPDQTAEWFNGQWHYYEFSLGYVASTDRYEISFYVDGALAGTSSRLEAGASVGGVTDVYVNQYGYEFGMFGVADIYATNNTSTVASAGTALNGYVGETTTARVARLTAEERVPVTIHGTSTTTMGPQGTATFLALIRECEAAENGLLYDGLGPGLGFVCRSERYNRAPDMVLTMAGASEIAYPFDPVDDDQRNVNVAKASRGGGAESGSNAVVEQVDGPLGTAAIGVYDTSTTVNVDTDDVLVDYAGWLVWQGTQAGFRYPSLNLNLAASPQVAATWLACSPSSRIDVTNVTDVATQHPDGDIRLLLEGWSEQLSPLDWDAQSNTSQYGPWEVGVLDEVQWTDCGATVLTEDLDDTETAIDVAISDTCVWWHADGDFDITVGDEQMTVTGVSAAAGSGSSWTQTLTVTRSVNGFVGTHLTGAEVHSTNAFTLAL